MVNCNQSLPFMTAHPANTTICSLHVPIQEPEPSIGNSIGFAPYEYTHPEVIVHVRNICTMQSLQDFSKYCMKDRGNL